MKNEKNMPLTVEELSKMNIFEALWNCNKNHLNEIAMTYSADIAIDDFNKKAIKRKITYKELFDNILKTYDTLKEYRVKKGDVITYSSIITPEVIYTLYASALLGSIFKPIDVRFGSDELLEQFKNNPSKLFFGSMPFIDRITPIAGDINVDKIVMLNFEESLPKIVKIGSMIDKKLKKIKEFDISDNNLFINWEKFISNGKVVNIPKYQVNKDEIIHLTATTGTTGKPKVIMHNSSNWNAQLYNISHCGFDFKRGENFFNCTVPWVDFGLINAAHTWMCNGITLDMDPTWTAEKNANYIIKNNPEWWMGGPGWLDDLFTNEKYKDVKLSNAKYYITGGAPLYPYKHELYQRRLKEMSKNGKIAPGYGFSEATAALSVDVENKAETIGRMMPLVDAKIVNPATGETVPKYNEGELWVASKSDILTQLSPGYYNNEKATNEVFIIDNTGKRWAKSGDKVKENEDGTYTWISRYKNILTYNGFNINCEKITERIDEIEGVKKTVVIGCVTEDGNQMPLICCEVVNNEIDKNLLKEEIKDTMKNTFPDYYTPKDIVFYDKFPVISMKLDMQQIKRDLLNENGEYLGDLKIVQKVKK